MKRILLLNLVVVFILLSISFVVTAADEEIISAIALEGNEVISDEEIKDVIDIKPGDLLQEDKIKADMQDIYELGYFQDVRVSFEVYNGGLRVIFELIENPVVTRIVFEGNDSIEANMLRELTYVKTGEILNFNQVVDSRKDIIEKYKEEGYIRARVNDINISEEGVLTFTINEGYLKDVVIKGNEKTKDFVILRELDFQQGEVLNIKEIQKGYQNLIRLNYFENIEPSLEAADIKANEWNLVLNLKETKTGNLGAGVTWSSKDGWLGFVDIRERNLLGNGQTLGFNWQFGGATNYSLNFHEPWLMGKPLSFGISLYDKSSDSTDSLKGDYQEHRQGGSVSLGHKIDEEWQGKVRLKLENSEIDWSNESYTDEGEEISLEDEKASVRSLTLQANRNTTNHPFFPTDGVNDTFSIEYAGQILGGDANFTKYNMEFSRYYPGFKRDQAWGLRVKTGIGSGELPELQKYRLGGSESLRGYKYGSFSGKNMLLMNLEYRFKIADNFTGVVFGDAGNTWDQLEEVDLLDMHYSLGAGVRVNTPIGLIRLDYGFNEEGGGQPNFSIGHTF